MEETITSSQPSQSSLHNHEEFQLFDDFTKDFLISNNDLLITSPAVKSKTAEELLLELDQKIEDEPSWLNASQKLDLAAFETISAVDITPTSQQPEYQQQPPITSQRQEPIYVQKNTEELLHEFDTVYNKVGLQLTPPITPPSSPSSVSVQDVTGAPIIYIIADTTTVQEPISVGEHIILDETISESSQESMEFIDELVRKHSFSLLDDMSIEVDDDYISSGGSLSPCSDTSDPCYSPRSESEQSSVDSFMSPKSEGSFDTAGFDEECTPAVDKLKAKRNHLKVSSVTSNGVKREKRPYGRPLHEKKARKKEQNKNAATRYRQKKKQELAVVLTEEQQLTQVHVRLQTQYDDVKREISYLKKLMKEILIAKGVQL